MLLYESIFSPTPTVSIHFYPPASLYLTLLFLSLSACTDPSLCLSVSQCHSEGRCCLSKSYATAHCVGKWVSHTHTHTLSWLVFPWQQGVQHLSSSAVATEESAASHPSFTYCLFALTSDLLSISCLWPSFIKRSYRRASVGVQECLLTPASRNV